MGGSNNNAESKPRAAGILMPISSLPSPCGIGTLGKAAYRFVDFLRGAGCKVWQVLPLQPTSFGNSPYSSCASGVFNPYFIDFDLLRKEGLLERREYCGLDWGKNPRRVDYGKQYALRKVVLKKAFARFDRSSAEWKEFSKIEKFHEFGQFMALKEQFKGASHEEWGEYAEFDGQLVAAFEKEHGDEVAFWQFTQYVFLRQWRALKKYANENGVKIMGDIPIYVARDSVEMWKYKRELFELDERGEPTAQAGVPPDAFSADGQLWGNPVYDWRLMKKSGYAWWHERLRDALGIYDILRIDHFIGFVRYYSVPIGAEDAKKGVWRNGPGAELFKDFEGKPIVAEDLGHVTWTVRRELDKTGYPGMKILQHAFDGDVTNEHKPQNYMENIVAYTGTHDNETLFSHVRSATGEARKNLLFDLRRECARAGVKFRGGTDNELCACVLRLLYASKARLILFPYQDALCLGDEGRMNCPSTVSNENWSFRFTKADFASGLKRRLRALGRQCGRR